MAAIPLVLLSLSGCANKAEHFDSEPGKGVVASISKTDALVDEGYFEEKEVAKAYTVNDIVLSQQNTGGTSLQRIPETSIRVWLPPYQDNQGNWCEGRYVHTLLKPAKWQLTRSKFNDEDL